VPAKDCGSHTAAVPVTVTVNVDRPWMLLLMICHCATAECQVLLTPSGSRGKEACRLVALLHQALQSAAGNLHQTAVSEKHVSSAVSAAATACSIACCLHVVSLRIFNMQAASAWCVGTVER
jgi:hypothetical protein